MTDFITVPKGLGNVVVDKTAIATTSNEGELLYRGYKAVELAEKKSFEDVAFLVVNGKLPTTEESRRFKESLIRNWGVSPSVRKVMEIVREKNVMRNIRSMISLYPFESKDEHEIFLKMESVLPQLCSDSYSISRSEGYREPKGDGFSGRFYSLITGKVHEVNERMFQKLMILYMEHEFNASTFALRVTASTLADPVSAVTSALATLKGPLHGGANTEVLEYLADIKNKNDAMAYVDEKIETKGKIMGFGHRVYKTKDPRAQFVKNMLKEAAPDHDLLLAAENVEEYLWEKKKLPANVDLYAAILMNYLGINEALYLPVFAASRIFGWNAHYFEQVADNKIIRPAAEYVGPEGLSL